MTFRALSIGFAFSTLLIYSLLVAALFYFLDPSLLSDSLASGRTLFSLRLSVLAATTATLLSLIIAVPAAFALSRYEFRGKIAIDTALELPMIVSPAALGAMILIFFNTPVGVWIQENWAQFVFTVHGVILAQFVTTCGIATRLVKAAIDEIPARYESVARSLGATPARAFLTVTLPLAKKGILAAAILSWAKALGEFGATITVAGSMAMKTETLPIAIFMRLSSAEVEGTVALILILIAIGLSILYGVRLLSQDSDYA